MICCGVFAWVCLLLFGCLFVLICYSEVGGCLLWFGWLGIDDISLVLLVVARLLDAVYFVV